MAANKGKLTEPQRENIRARIQTDRLIKRLQCFALDENDPANGLPVELDPQKMKAFEILLRKSLPDLASVTLETGEKGFHVHLHQDAKKA